MINSMRRADQEPEEARRQRQGIWVRLSKEISALDDEEDGDWIKELALTKKGGSVEVETGIVPDRVSEAVAMNEMQEKDIKGEEPRRLKNLNDQEDSGDGVRAKDSLTGDNLEEMMGEKGGERRR